jgi:hypothetical protein
MKIKKNRVLMGLLSVLLMAGMMFIACPMDSGNSGDNGDNWDGLSVPTPDNLPGLPDDVRYVTSEAEAIALLNGLGAVFSSVDDATASLSAANTRVTDIDNGYKYEWSVKDDTSIPGLKINITGEVTSSANPSNFMEEDYNPAAGDFGKKSMTDNTTVDFIADHTEGGAVVYKKSRITTKIKGSYSEETVTSVSGTSPLGSVKHFRDDAYADGLTASSGGKGGKIIFDAKVQGSFVKSDYNISDGEDRSVYDYSGSLKVYGANNTEVYAKNIAAYEDYREALALIYF